jgi:hypothetical protein
VIWLCVTLMKSIEQVGLRSDSYEGSCRLGGMRIILADTITIARMNEGRKEVSQ